MIYNSIAELEIETIPHEGNKYRARFFAGSEIKQAIGDLLVMAATLHRRITADFNGVELVADFPELVNNEYNRWQKLMDGESLIVRSRVFDGSKCQQQGYCSCSEPQTSGRGSLSSKRCQD